MGLPGAWIGILTPKLAATAKPFAPWNEERQDDRVCQLRQALLDGLAPTVVAAASGDEAAAGPPTSWHGCVRSAEGAIEPSQGT